MPAGPRRSARLQGGPPPTREADVASSEAKEERTMKRFKASPEASLVSRASAPGGGGRDQLFGFRPGEVHESPEYENPHPRRSSMEIPADLQQLDQLKGMIVVPRLALGNNFKAAVMQAASPDEPPRFSKYGGLQSFRNALLLFVNVGCVTYENGFYLDEKSNTAHLSWFAQDRHDEDSPVIARLTGGRTPVFGFVRAEGGPYLACGRLRLVDWDKRSRPLKFHFEISADLLELPKPNRLKQLLNLHAELQEEED